MNISMSELIQEALKMKPERVIVIESTEELTLLKNETLDPSKRIMVADNTLSVERNH